MIGIKSGSATNLYYTVQMANQRPHNKTLTLTTSAQAAKSCCTATVGTLTAENQVRQCWSLSGLQTEHHFNGILGALPMKAGGRTGKRLFL